MLACREEPVGCPSELSQPEFCDVDVSSPASLAREERGQVRRPYCGRVCELLQDYEKGVLLTTEDEHQRARKDRTGRSRVSDEGKEGRGNRQHGRRERVEVEVMIRAIQKPLLGEAINTCRRRRLIGGSRARLG